MVGVILTNNATQVLHITFHTRRHNRKRGNLSRFAGEGHACRICGDLSHHDCAHLYPCLPQGRAGRYRKLRKRAALDDAAVDYLCFMPDLPLAPMGICEVAHCRRVDLYDPCRDCQYGYETSVAGIISNSEGVPFIIPVRFLLIIVLTWQINRIIFTAYIQQITVLTQ